jgi:putative ABC transport system permease protein
VLAAGLLLDPGLGAPLALMSIAVLQHIFDPPPDHLALPWAHLGELADAALATTTLAVAITASRLKMLPLGRLLREQ